MNNIYKPEYRRMRQTLRTTLGYSDKSVSSWESPEFDQWIFAEYYSKYNFSITSLHYRSIVNGSLVPLSDLIKLPKNAVCVTPVLDGTVIENPSILTKFQRLQLKKQFLLDRAEVDDPNFRNLVDIALYRDGFVHMSNVRRLMLLTRMDNYLYSKYEKELTKLPGSHDH